MGKLNIDAMKSKLDAESKASNFSNTEYDKLEQGKNVRRILFPKGNNDSFYSEGYVHFGVGAEGKSVATCAKTFGSKERCPICEYAEKLSKSKDQDDKKLANDIKAKRRIYVNVINRDAEEDTPKVLPIGVTILKGILETICDADYGDITDPEDGRDITITRKGTGLKTEYSVLPKPKSSVVSEEHTPEELEELMTDLDSLFIKKSYEELEAVLNGEEPNKDDDDDKESDEYDDMSIDELIELCEEYGIDVPSKPSRLKLIKLLNDYDASDVDNDEETEDDEPPFDKDEEDDDSVKNAITAAIARRKGKK